MRKLATFVLAAFSAASFGATLTAQWNFNNNLASALTGGQPLVASKRLDGNEPSVDPTQIFTTDMIGGQSANVLRFENNSWGNGYLIAPHSIAPNGGGDYVNQYTLVMDVKVMHTTGEGWQGIAGTNIDTYNDADFYFRLDGSDAGGEYAALGIGSYGGKVYWNNWNRIAITVDAANETDGMRFYANGSLVNARSGGGLDGRWALYSTLDTTPWLILFGEGDTSGNYTNPLMVSSVQTYDGVLTDAQIAALGGPTASKLPGSLPGSTTLTGTVTLGGYAGDPTIVPLTVSLIASNGTTALTKVVTADGTGKFSFGTSLTGTYRVLVKAPSTLMKQIGSATLTGSGTADAGSGTLLAGDIDGDNQITVFDYNALSASFDKSSSDPDWNTVGGSGFAPKDSDLDGDGAITVFDYNLLSQNFDMVGDT